MTFHVSSILSLDDGRWTPFHYLDLTLQCLWEAETDGFCAAIAAVSAIVNTKRWNAV
jgi:hypothetical protein